MKKMLRSLFYIVIASVAITACSKEDPDKQYASLLSEAAEYKEENKLEEARITLLSAIDIKPKEAKAYYELAETIIQQKKFGPALENYQTALNLDPSFWKARLRLAALLLASKKLELAESHVSELAKTHPGEIEVKLLEANVENTKGNRKKAREILTPLREKHPDNAAVLASLANIEISDGNIEEAAALYEKVVELEPANDGIKLALADIYIRTGDKERGQQIIEKLIETNPKNTALRFRFAEFLLKQGQAEGALEQYKAVLEIDPQKHYARDRLYDMYLIRKVVSQAKQLGEELKKEHPDDPAVFYFDGRRLELEGKKKEALASYLRAIPGMNNFAPAFRRAGLLEIQFGKKRQGIEHLQQAIAIDPGDVGARLGLARDLFQKKELTQAKEHLAAVLRRYPKQIGANVLAADIALVEGNTEGARNIYETMIESFPDAPLNYMKLGLVEERDGKIARAEELYEKALSFDKNVSVPARRLAAIILKKDGFDAAVKTVKELYEDSRNSKVDYGLLLGTLYASEHGNKDFDKAREYFKKVIEIDPDNFTAYFALARLDGLAGNPESALKRYEEAVKIKPDHVPSRMLLGLTNEGLGNFEEAIKQYSEILKRAPKFGPAANNLAWLYAEGHGGNLDEALSLAKVAKEQLPDVGGVADTLGWIYFKRGTPELALPYIEEAIQHERSTSDGKINPEILFHYASVLKELDKEDEAKKIMKEVLDKVNAEHPKHAEMKSFADSLS